MDVFSLVEGQLDILISNKALFANTLAFLPCLKIELFTFL